MVIQPHPKYVYAILVTIEAWNAGCWIHGPGYHSNGGMVCTKSILIAGCFPPRILVQCLYSSFLYPKNISFGGYLTEIRNTDGFYSGQKHTILNTHSPLYF